jgi:predicted RNase H-like nuclease (RuvC/YqgF family)
MKLMERQKKEIEELDRKLMKISITLSKEVGELRELERSLEELKTSIFVDNLIKLMKGRVKQTFRGIGGSYKKIKEIERRISLKKQRIAQIELEKANLEELIRRARAPPTILELLVRPKEVHVSSVMLVWVPIAEARALVGNRMVLVKANCFNGIVSAFQ